MEQLAQLDKALEAHAKWKARLRMAIAMGKCETPISQIRADDQCDFGKWLKGPAAQGPIARSSHFAEVKRLHAAFHQEAARVATAAGEGRKDAAEKAMATNGTYASASAALTNALFAWKWELERP